MVPVITILMGAVLWGLTWWPIKSLSAQGLHGPVLTVIAYGAGALVLLPFLWRQRLRCRGHARLLWLIFLFGGFANLAYTIAMVHGQAIRVMLLFYLAPVWATLGGRYFLNEHIDALRFACLTLALTGAFLVLGGPAVFQSPPSLIDLLAISSGFGYAMNNLAFRRAQAVPVASKNAAMFCGCTLMALLVAIGGGLPLLPEAAPTVYAGAVLFGAVWLLLATGTAQYGVTHMAASRSAILLTLELPITIMSAALIAGERMSVMEMAGGVLILSSVVIESRRAGPISAPVGIVAGSSPCADATEDARNEAESGETAASRDAAQLRDGPMPCPRAQIGRLQVGK